MSCEACKKQKFEKVCRILEEHQADKSNLIPILHAVQREYRYLPEEILTYIATSLKMPPAKVYGVASFYAHFALEPKGKYVIHVCDGTACHVKGSIAILEAMQGKLGLDKEKCTTDDQLFTVETVSCLGACGMAPVITINEDVYGLVTPEKAGNLIEEILEKEKA
ncbi:NADP-reducing hydrogenase subunit HndA [Sedimentisphaera cyanobacteriorum]|uniref:NADP-reducing hydrogenase subunit HndA n=1 Tax=Sedimentisphaera cyanobacteriorum TaxID=1940790 RepID=A0A1Q2HQ44_9BACT|nr:NAD(P)H-dependent oxidoreductase subunit E [Sedimentisphaera cyanobacteriorum]AQQ09480.1 NADP-reducing hydrogenase subunit HndA [Sedimentisphaera cyanobacteriorum]